MTWDPAQPRRRRILMCRPEHYGIEYEINPWMKVDRAANREFAIRQWESLVAIVKEMGAEVELVEPVAGLPDMVFTANAGVVHRDRFIPSHFRHKERQGETPFFERWFLQNGFQIADVYSAEVARSAFEGAGDALYCGESLFAGYLNRSDIAIHLHLARLLDCRVLSLELVDPYYYHLDTCFCPLEMGRALYYPAAFDEYGRRILTENIDDLIAVEESDARQFGCNAVVVARGVVVHSGCERLAAQLHERGYEVFRTDLSEFLKSGGSAKCLTLRLDGEEAAAWAQTVTA